MSSVAWISLLALGGGMLGAAFGELVSQEIRTRLDRIPQALIHVAALRLPANLRAELTEEWLAELHEILSGKEALPITRIVIGTRYAVGLVRTSPTIGRELGERPHAVKSIELAISSSPRRKSRRRLPRVAEVQDPTLLGVHPSVVAMGGPVDRCPQFVQRDVSYALATALLRDRFVLLVGDSVAGKSRAAFEAVQVVAPGHRLIVPADSEAVSAAAALAAKTKRSLLWLDDLERFFWPHGLTAALVSNILAVGGDQLIMATISSRMHARFSGLMPSIYDAPDSETLREGRDVLRLATCLTLDRHWSAAELSRAARSSDPRIAHALQGAARFGVGEYLAAAPELLDKWREG